VGPQYRRRRIRRPKKWNVIVRSSKSAASDKNCLNSGDFDPNRREYRSQTIGIKFRPGAESRNKPDDLAIFARKKYSNRGLDTYTVGEECLIPQRNSST
jgi:hypothetical protein